MDINDIIILDGIDKMDFEKITGMLSQASWSLGIKKDEIIQGAVNCALVTGAFYNGNKQIGYARVISDKTRVAYISDVYVDEAYRKIGVARKMLRHILEHDSLKDVYQWILSSDADELYQKLGFVPLSKPAKWMEIRHERPNR